MLEYFVLGLTIVIVGIALWDTNRQNTRRDERLFALLNIVIEQQGKTQHSVKNATNEVAKVCESQGKVLGSYLQMFQTPEEPKRYTRDIKKENRQFLEGKGFPLEGTETEQAQWVLENM